MVAPQLTTAWVAPLTHHPCRLGTPGKLHAPRMSASVSGPSQPVINTATAGNESISLGFALSTTPDALFPITGYEAECSGLTEIETTQGVGSPLSVGNLTNYREYDCTVAPVTGLGALPMSSSVYSKPLDPAILWFLLRPTNTEDEDE